MSAARVLTMFSLLLASAGGLAAGEPKMADGPGRPPMAALTSGEFQWTDNISHGELLRDGRDQRLDVDPAHLRFLFQGVLDRDRQGKNYGQIPWRLGLLGPEATILPPRGQTFQVP
ncbi:MAG: hypothetical protein FJ291_05860 [Planctomycetes bacterium]|nr:hypothetical protein [Planctomycetota bacterium]